MIPKVSVIVPIYNVEPYVSRCLDSLTVQTLKEIEIILIDDGSTDGSGKIADGYAAQDGRFMVVHQSNQGLSAARNTGIELASADYLMFVDSDDWVEPDFCRIPFEAAEEYSADMVMFRSWKDGFKPKTEFALLPEGLLSKEEAMSLLFHYPGFGEAAWNKLYHRALFQEVRYPEGYLFEDSGTTFELVQRSGRILARNTRLYHYCYRSDSIANSKTIDKWRDYYEMRMRAALGLRAYGYIKLADEIIANVSLTYLIYFGRDTERSGDCLRVLCNEKQVVTNGTWRRKGLVLILRFSPRLFDLICVLCGKRR